MKEIQQNITLLQANCFVSESLGQSVLMFTVLLQKPKGVMIMIKVMGGNPGELARKLARF